MASCWMTTVQPSGFNSSTTPLAANVRAFVPVVSAGRECSAAVTLKEISKPPNKALTIAGHNLIFKEFRRELSRVRQLADAIECGAVRCVRVHENLRVAGGRVGDNGGPIGQRQIGRILNNITQAHIRSIGKLETRRREL